MYLVSSTDRASLYASAAHVRTRYNWILNAESIKKMLKSFQGELTKRILKWPKHFSNTAATIAIGLQSVESRILERKLSYQWRI